MAKSVSLKFLGGAGTVTGSKTLVEFNGNRVLIDCGLFQGPRVIRDQNWQVLPHTPKIQAVILTHAHIDHSGFLPKLVKDGFSGPVYCSAATADLCRIMLMDSAFLQEEDARYANASRYSRHQPALPLYTQEDAKRAIELLKPMAYNEWAQLGPGLDFTLSRSGHILGSSFVTMNFEGQNGSRQITFSGDIGNGRSFVIRAPVNITGTDYLILESTYGDRLQPREDTASELAKVINKVMEREGTLVIPAFTVGRTQELLYLIRVLEEKRRIQPVPVYLDSPMALDATQIYMNHPDELKLVDHGSRFDFPICSSCFRPVRSSEESMLLCMNSEPKIVISAAGMLTGGRILHHLKHRLPDKKNGVLFVGYQAEGTKGLLLKNGLREIHIHHQKVVVEAEIFSMESLSAHADSDDIMAWLKRFSKPPEMVFLNHGETNALNSLAYRIRHELEWPVAIPSQGQTFHINKSVISP